MLVARGIRNGTIHLSPAGQAAVNTPPPLNCKPAPCALKNVDASTGTTQPVDETPIAVNSLNAKQLITGGNDYNCTSSSYRGFWTSNDAGKTWAGACAKDETGSSGGGGDPIVGYDLLGNVFQGGIDFLTNGAWAISVAKSTDNGKTWGNPVQAVQVGSDLADKPWMQIDTHSGSRWPNWIYISNTMFGSGSSSTIYVTHSTDSGKTWTSVAVSPTEQLPHVNQFSDLAIDSTGKVYVTYMDCAGGGNTGDCGGTTATMYIQSSNDGGTTWTKQKVIATATLAPDTCGSYYGTLPNTCERMSNVPVVGVDASGGTHNGNLYIAYYNYTGAYMQELVTTSTDGGSTWSKGVPVAPKSDTHDQFFNWLSVDNDGNVGVTWMDRGADPSNLSYTATATWSGDGGTSFHTDVPIASAPSNPNNDGFGGGFMGDYSGNYWYDRKLYASWTDTRNGSYSQDEVGGLKR